MEAARTPRSLTRFEQLQFARDVIRQEADALYQLAEHLPTSFSDAVELLRLCEGCAIVTGMGKAGLVGQKIAATLASTGMPSHFLHPGEAIHGDLGRLRSQDVVVALSLSGETEEIVRLLPPLTERHNRLIAITRNQSSRLGRAATVTIQLGPLQEAGGLGLAPSTSTTAMLAVGDALALLLSHLNGFGREDFARFHPGGSLGRKLAKVDDVLRGLDVCRMACDSGSIRDVLVNVSKPGRRSGAILLTDREGALSGIFTDSDLAKLLESRNQRVLDEPIASVMTQDPRSIMLGARLADAVLLMAETKISELPVVDQDNCPQGVIDITDLVGLLPADTEHITGRRATVPFSKAD
jgi:arabinose-5-phosphate isomerase